MLTAVIIIGHLACCYAGMCIGYRVGVIYTTHLFEQAFKDHRGLR